MSVSRAKVERKDGVADLNPGSGYGATTFPALTEAFTIEKNSTLAEYETKRLQEIVEGLAELIKV